MERLNYNIEATGEDWWDCVEWLIDKGLMPLPTIFQSYHGNQFTYSCVSWLSNTSTPHTILSKQLAAFPQRLLNSPLVKYELRRSQWLLSNVGKNVGRAGILTHNPWIDSPRRYQLSYRPRETVWMLRSSWDISLFVDPLRHQITTQGSCIYMTIRTIWSLPPFISEPHERIKYV